MRVHTRYTPASRGEGGTGGRLMQDGGKNGARRNVRLQKLMRSSPLMKQTQRGTATRGRENEEIEATHRAGSCEWRVLGG